MRNRTAHTKKVRINSLSYSSIFDIGDANQFTPYTEAIAVQKEGGVETEEGFEFEKYEIFDRKSAALPSLASVNQETVHHHANIYVNNVDITGVSSSSLVQIGSLKTIDAESRIKHIRILEEEE